MSILDGLFNVFKRKENPKRRVYDHDERLISTLKNAAFQQGRSPEEVLNDAVKLGDQQVLKQRTLTQLWDTLSPREQEVTALICLEYNRNQIAEVLGVTSGTIRTHMESIYKKFGVHTAKHLSSQLSSWDMLGWWEQRHP